MITSMRLFSKIQDRFGAMKWMHSGSRYFQLELGTRHRTYVQPARLILIVTCAIVGVGGLWSLANALVAWKNLQEVRERVAQVRLQDTQLLMAARGEGIDLSDASLRQLPAEVALANRFLAKRNFSWTQFLAGLEEVIPPNVSIRGVRLDPGSTAIHMTGVAATVEDITALTLSLQTHPVFHDPQLGEHVTGADGLVEFDLRLKYNAKGGKTT